jgi:hypothetical protein
MPCGLITNRRFGGTCRLHLQYRKNNVSEEKVLYGYTVRLTDSLVSYRLTLFFYPEDGGETFVRNAGFIINPGGATSSQTAFFTVYRLLIGAVRKTIRYSFQ